jgi:hypothetical protein
MVIFFSKRKTASNHDERWPRKDLIGLFLPFAAATTTNNINSFENPFVTFSLVVLGPFD